MAAQPAPCWGSLPAELLARVFDAEGPPALLSLRVAGYGPPTLVLSIEERARAEGEAEQPAVLLAAGCDHCGCGGGNDRAERVKGCLLESIDCKCCCRLGQRRWAGAFPPAHQHEQAPAARSAAVVCKHWRAALSSHPATYSSLALGPKHFAKDLQQGRARAIRRALGAAAKVPVVQHIRLWASRGDNPALVEANNAALQPMLSCKVGCEASVLGTV